MNIVDTHNHIGPWSPDAKQTYENLMHKAAIRGISGAAISDHFDPDLKCFTGEPWIFNVQDYMDAFYSKRRLPSKRGAGEPPGFLLSIELGWTRGGAEALRGVIRKYPFDYAVLSIHHLDYHDPFSAPDFVYKGTLEDTYGRVINAIADSAEDIPEARIIGHYDFFSRYAPEQQSKMVYRHAPDAFDRLFRVMRDNGQVLEINTSTIENLVRRKGYAIGDAMPDRDILFRYRELGGRFLTLASDAHLAEQNGRMMKEAIDYLTSLGFCEFAWFETGELFFSKI